MWGYFFVYVFGSHLLSDMEHIGTRERGPWTDEIRVIGQPLDLAWIDYRNPYQQLQAGLSYLPPLPHGLSSSGPHAVPDMHIITVDESASSHILSSPWTEPTWVGGHVWYHTPGLPEAPMARVCFHEYTNPEAWSSSRRRRGYSEQYYHSPSSSMTGTNDYRYNPNPAMEDSPQQSYYSTTPHRSPRQWQSEHGSDTPHMQMVRYRPDDAHDGRNSSRHRENPYHQESEHVHEDTWDISATNNPGSPSTHPDSRRSLPGSEYSPASMYTDSSSSGYVESYHDDVRSYGSYRDYGDSGYEGDSDGMSDGIASDEGVYDSSSSDRGDFEDDGDSYEAYSDGGYSSDHS